MESNASRTEKLTGWVYYLEDKDLENSDWIVPALATIFVLGVILGMITCCIHVCVTKKRGEQPPPAQL